MSHRYPLAVLLILALLPTVAGQVVAQPAAVDEWTVVTSRNFVLYSDLEPAAAREIALNLELFRSLFSRLAPELDLRSPAPSRIFAFRDEESYAPYKMGAEDAEGRIVGQFLSHRDGNYITLNAGQQRVDALAVIYHEFTHYLVQHNLPPVPRWFNEGLAEYYGTFSTDDRRAAIGLPPARYPGMLAGAADLDLEELLLRDADRGDREHPAFSAWDYARSWGLVHWLLSSGDESLVRTGDLLARLEGGADALEALEESFGLRLDELEERLQAYFAGADLPVASFSLESFRPSEPEVRPASAAAVLAELGHLAAHIGRPDAAERHFSWALDRDPTRAEALAGLASLRSQQNRAEEAEALFRQALALEAPGPLPYLLYGRHRLASARGGGEEALQAALDARRAFALALEREPEFAEARAMLGYAHLFGEPDPATAVLHLEAAVRRLPGRMDLVLYLTQSLLAAGDRERAERLIEEVMAPRAEPALLETAREELERSKLLAEARQALEEERPREALRLLDRAASITSDPALRQRLEREVERLQRRSRP